MSRIAAWTILRSGSPTPLREVDGVAAARGLDARDRALVRRLVGTEVRRRGTLRAIVRVFARGKPKADLRAHLHLGLAQLLFLDRVPDHAAVSETVDAAARTIGASKAPYVNGVLRAVLRARREGSSGDPRRDLVGRPWHFDEPLFRDPSEHPTVWAEDALSIPAALMKRWTARRGPEAARALAERFLAEPDLSLRAVATDRDAVEAELAAADLPARPARHPKLLRLDAARTEAALASDAFRSGRLTVQGEASLRAAELVAAAPGERVLDLCAAPGGKASALLEAGASVLCCDVSADKLARLGETLERLGLAERADLRVSDGTAAVPERDFDAVLVDAPCSNSGVLGARPGARWRFGPRTLASLVELQQRLLEEGAAKVRPGGRLVWSTCSLEPEENEQLVRSFLSRNGDWELADSLETLPEEGDGPIDGGAAFRLERRRPAPPRLARPPAPGR